MSNISRTVKSDYFTDTQEATGFLDPSAIGVSYDTTNRTITLTQAGGVVYYWRGQKIVLTSPWTSLPHSEGNGVFYLSSTDGMNFTWGISLWDFSDIQVAFAAVSGSVKFALREVHGLMPWQTHLVLHSRVGTFRVSGGTLDGATYTVNTASDVASTPGFTESVIMDEDLPSTVLATPDGTYTTLRIGAGNTPTFDIDAAFPFRVANPAIPDTYLLVNNPTTGAETAGINNRFYNVYDIMVPVTSDADSQKYRRLLLQPQVEYTSLASAQAEDPRSLSLGTLTSLTSELVFNARITYNTQAGSNNTGKCKISTGGVTYITGSAMSQVSLGGFNTTSAQNVLFTPAGTISATNVQEAIEEVVSDSALTFALASSFIAGAGALTGPASPLTIGTAAAAATTDFQAADTDLAAIAALTTNGLIERTGAGTAAIVTVTTAGKAILDDATAAAQCTTLGLGTGSNPEFLTVDPTNGVRTTNENVTAGVGNAPLYTCFSNNAGLKTFSISPDAGANQGFKIHFPVASIGISGTIWLRGDYNTVNAFGLLTYDFTVSANNSTDWGTTFALDKDIGTTADYISLHSITHSTGDHIFEFRRVGTAAITFTVVFNVIKVYGNVTFDGQLASAWFETFTYS